MTERESGTAVQPLRSDGTEYLFKIDAYTPETMPMARLAEYMAQLALVLGEPASVHFTRLESGSTGLVHRIQREAIPKVRSRTEAIRRGDAPRDALRAYHTINKLLRDDNGAASLTEPLSGVVLNFPGREEAQQPHTVVKQEGRIDGRIVRVGGTEQQVPVILQAEGEPIIGCYADRHVAKQLAGRLFEYVRVHGMGRWRRDNAGAWSLERFRIRSFDVLRTGTLSSVLKELHELSGDFEPEAYADLSVIRHGSDGRGNGSH